MLRRRYRRILWFFSRVLIRTLFWDILLSHTGLRGIARRTRPSRMRHIASGFRKLAVDMGGVMIKVGQFMSSRLDVLPREITDELSGLQDEVAPEHFEDVRRVVEDAFSQPLETVFDNFNPAPMASASIGQVHTARIRRTGNNPQNNIPESVVVKVQRPNIEALVDTDLNALKVVASWANLYKPIRKHVDVGSLISELERSIREEMDYMQEGRYVEQFAENYKADENVVIPQVVWECTRKKVLTLENVMAVKIGDYAAIESAGISRSEVADRLFDIYLHQIFVDRFFHADPHPGNLFIKPLAEPVEGVSTPWQLVFIDFGMMGHVPATLSRGMRELLIAVGTQDTKRMVKGFQDLDILLPSADLEMIEKMSAAVFDRFWGLSTSDMLKMKHEVALDFVAEFSELMFDMPFQLPENFILLGRCLSILSGMCTGLNPEFNVWHSVAPYAEKLIKEEQKSTVQMALDEGLKVVKLLAALPQKTDRLITRMEQGKLAVSVPELEKRVGRLESQFTRLISTLLFAVFFMGFVQFYLSGNEQPAWFSGVLAVISLLYLLFKR